jgi:ABC-type transporter Mla subunit MlaD
MASQRIRSRNNIKAGLLTIVCLILFVVWTIAVGDLLEIVKPKNRYVVNFPLAMGTQGLSVGSPIEVGGQPVGRVDKITRELDGNHGDVVAVTIAVARDLAIYENAHVELRRPLLGAGAAINFSTLGDSTLIGEPGNGDPLLQTDLDERLIGYLAPGFLTQLGFTKEDIEAVRQTLANLEDISERATRMAKDIEEELPGRFEDFEKVTQDLAAVVEDTRARWPEWLDQVDGVMARADTVTGNAEAISRDVQEGVEEVRTLVARVQGEFDEAAPKVQTALTNIEEGAAIAKEDLIALIDEARKGLDGYAALGDQLKRFRTEQQPNLERTLANARLASEQLKLTTLEVRRAPWRLLYRPNQRELEEELLYDAARSYAQAVNDLWSASNALREVSVRSEGSSADDRAQLEHLMTQMDAALSSYQEVEEKFLAKLEEE